MGEEMSKRDIAQIQAIARQMGWGPDERRAFGRLVEDCKEQGSRGGAGARGTDFTYEDLLTMARTGDCP